MKDLDKDTFDQEVLAHQGVTLVDFWSETCETCQEIMPQMEALERELGQTVSFAKVNIQGNRRLAIREKVLGLPTVVIYRNGERTASFSKEFTTDQIRAAVAEAIGG
jgi:thioredoxin 1